MISVVVVVVVEVMFAGFRCHTNCYSPLTGGVFVVNGSVPLLLLLLLKGGTVAA